MSQAAWVAATGGAAALDPGGPDLGDVGPELTPFVGPAGAPPEEDAACQQSHHADEEGRGMAEDSWCRGVGDKCAAAAVVRESRLEVARQVRQASIRQGERRESERFERHGHGLYLERGGGGTLNC